MSREKKNLGDWGEGQACDFLRRHGFVVLERNYHTTFGEIDIVASLGGDYYFIEVKTRANRDLANDYAITFAKKKKIAQAVRSFCYSRRVSGVSLITAAVIVEIDRIHKKAKFRFCAFC